MSILDPPGASRAALNAEVVAREDADSAEAAEREDADAAVQAYAIQRAHHTGTQAESTVTGLVDDLNAKAPINDPMFTGTVTVPTTGSGVHEAATKAYVDAVAQGLSIRRSVVCATTANITLSGEQTIDGVLTAASRVLVKDQNIATTNGIYVSAAGAWARATDMDANNEVASAFVFVRFGPGVNANGGSGWAVADPGPYTLGTTPIAWTQTSAAGQIGAVAPLVLTGSQLSVTLDPDGTLAANSDTRIASQRAIKSAIATETAAREAADLADAPAIDISKAPYYAVADGGITDNTVVMDAARDDAATTGRPLVIPATAPGAGFGYKGAGATGGQWRIPDGVTLVCQGASTTGNASQVSLIGTDSTVVFGGTWGPASGANPNWNGQGHVTAAVYANFGPAPFNASGTFGVAPRGGVYGNLLIIGGGIACLPLLVGRIAQGTLGQTTVIGAGARPAWNSSTAYAQETRVTGADGFTYQAKAVLSANTAIPTAVNGVPQSNANWQLVSEAGIVMTEGQNLLGSQLQVTACAGLGMIFEGGTAGHGFDVLEVNQCGSTGSPQVATLRSYDTSAGAHALAPIPQEFQLRSVIIERPHVNATCNFFHACGKDISIDGLILQNYGNTAPFQQIRMLNDGTNLSLRLHVSNFFLSGDFSGNASTTAFDIASGCSVLLDGLQVVQNANYLYKLGSTAQIETAGITQSNVTNQLDPASTGTIDGCVQRRITTLANIASASILKALVTGYLGNEQTNTAAVPSVPAHGWDLYNVNTQPQLLSATGRLATLGPGQAVFVTSQSKSMVQGDGLAIMTSATSDATYTLLAPTGLSGTRVTVKRFENVTAHNATINVAGGGSIDGSTTYPLTDSYQSVTFESIGSQWSVVGEKRSSARPYVTVGLTTGDYKVSGYASGQAAVMAANAYLVASGALQIDGVTRGGTIVLLDTIECTDATIDCGVSQYAAVALGDYVDIVGTLAWANGASSGFTHQGANQSYLLNPGLWSRVDNVRLWGRGNYLCPINGVNTLTASGTNTLGGGMIVTKRRLNIGLLHVEGFAEHGVCTNAAAGPTLGFQMGTLRVKACGGTGFQLHAWGVDGEIDKLWVGSCGRNIDLLATELTVNILHTWGSAEHALVLNGANGSGTRIGQAYIESNAGWGIYLNGASRCKFGIVNLWGNGLDGAHGGIFCNAGSHNYIGHCDARDNIGVQLEVTGASHDNDFGIDIHDEYAALDDSSATITHPVTVSAGSTTVTFADAPLLIGSSGAPSKHVHCWLVIPGAGPAGATLTSAHIASVTDASHCELDVPVSTAVSGAAAIIRSVYAGVWEAAAAGTLDTAATPNTYRGVCHIQQVLNSQVFINPTSQVLGMVGVNSRATKVIAASGSALALVWRDYDTADVTLDHATVTASFFPSNPILNGKEVTAILRQDATGSRAFVWPANVKPAGGAFAISTTPTYADMWRFRYDGTNWQELSRSIGIH